MKIIVAYPPGQSTDIATRYFANKLTQAMGQSFIVENKPGASGNIGTAAAARATPDGYTLIMGAIGTHAINPALYDNPGFDAEKDFDAIVLTALIPFAISAGPSAGINSLTELIALARSKPGKVDVAIPSVTGQLVLEMLKQRDVPLFAVQVQGLGRFHDRRPLGRPRAGADRHRRRHAHAAGQDQAAGRDHRSADGVDARREDRERAGPAQFQRRRLERADGAARACRRRSSAKLAAEMRKILDLPETQTSALADLGFERAPVAHAGRARMRGCATSVATTRTSSRPPR